MKTLTIVLGSVVLALVLVVAGLWAGTAWAQERWESNLAGYGPMGYGMMGGDWEDMAYSQNWQNDGRGGYGMMGPGAWGGDWQNMPYGAASDMPCSQTYGTPGSGEVASLGDAQAAVEDYVARLGYGDNLRVAEMMEFDHNYYAIVAEADTGIGAMEVLVDKSSGTVGPEPGPNMMWNAEYSMMGRGGGMMGMMGGYGTDEMTLSPEEAQDVAQRWLDANIPGRTAGEPDAFYGYYTLHFLEDGKIEGMLSVHGGSGDVWYHSWHGDFVTMSEGHE